LVNKELFDCNLLFIDVQHIARSQVEALRAVYPHLLIIPVLEVEYGEQADPLRDIVEAVITTPILPSPLYKALSKVWKKLPPEAVQPESIAEKPIAPQREAKILVAEDNMINLRLLETILLQHKFKVTTVDNGQKAVDAYMKEPFDLVLMDIDMPVMDGLTANRLIKEIDKRDNRGFTPVIALTAHALIGDRERIIGAGLDAHLAKPIDKHFLLQTIERYLQIAQDKRKQETV
jgi:CheY-like chemotaxis protein